jgi:hypothetical protein
MSSTDNSSEAMTESSTEQTGGLGEIIPEPLVPIWRRIELIQSFREANAERYIAVLEILTAAVLIIGYIWWMYLYLLGGS